MNRYRIGFGSIPRLFPVVHVRSAEQALQCVQTIQQEGADGVFLIGHGLVTRDLLSIYHTVRGGYLKFWMGLNILSTTPASFAAQVLPESAQALWTDDSGVVDQGDGTAGDPLIRERLGHRLHFGGVAFKYQAQPADLGAAAAGAANHLDVVTTTGVATGVSADISKIVAMRTALGDHPLALASGVDAGNIARYVDAGVDAFLVATSITDPASELTRSGAVSKLLSAMGR